MCQPEEYTMVQTHAEVSSPENISEIPQRSRNARAQARHRAKRKAYIERLEENVAKLQAVLGLSSDQVAELPPAAVLTNRYAELEMENRQLHEQLRSLQNAIQNGRIHLDDHNPTRWSPGSPTVAEFPQFGFMTSDDGQVCREAKKRKISFDAGLSYPSNNHPLLANHGGTASFAPRPLLQHSVMRGGSADNHHHHPQHASSGPLLPSSYNLQQGKGSTDGIPPITIKTEPNFGDASILASASFLIITVFPPTSPLPSLSHSTPILHLRPHLGRIHSMLRCD
ncbi:hypothetical protein FRC19_009790, partial [Serendipita sp. 401]